LQQIGCKQYNRIQKKSLSFLLNYAQLSELIAILHGSGRIAGINFAIYDPERDPNKRYAGPLVQCIANGLR
jgi:arginase